MLGKNQLLDYQYLAMRGKLLEVAAFLDRIDRAEGEADFRFEALQQVLRALADCREPKRARLMLELLSDQTSEPLEAAGNKAACGAPEPSTNPSLYRNAIH